MLIPDRIWVQMTEDEQRLVRETVTGLRAVGKTVKCPHCAGQIHISVKSDISAVDPESRQRSAIAADPFDALPASQRRLVEAAEASGLMDAFVAATRAEREHVGVPQNMRIFFLQFWQLAQPTVAPRHALEFWRDEFGGWIEVWQAQGVLAVMSDRVVRAFAPLRFLKTQKAVPGRAVVDSAPQWETWKRGRFGYVPAGATSFSEALRQANVGKFGAIVQ